MNLKFKVYRLHFTAPLHISDIRDDASISQRTVFSDTLYAALTSCLAKVGKIPKSGDLGCTISDLFPFYQLTSKDKPVFFLPMPLQTTLPNLTDPADAKKVKKVKWVDAELYGRLLNGEKFFDKETSCTEMIQAYYLTKVVLPVDSKGSKDFICSDVMQRVKVEDRTGEKPALPYYVDRISFKDESGLYFLALGNTALLEEAMQILKMEGIGTDRHVGYGFFDFEKQEDFIINVPDDATHQVSLSVFIPESEDKLKELLSDDKVAYDFTRRGGWVTTHPYNTIRKNAIYAFTSGSVFCGTSEGFCSGQIVDLKPKGDDGKELVNHSIWRNGRSIMLPIKM